MTASRTVTDIRPAARGSRRRVIWLDGEPWRAMAIDVVAELAIVPDLVVDPEYLEAQAHLIEPDRARARALRLLAHRERSRSELVGRLMDDGYPEDVARHVVEALASTGLVDDVRFAEVLARSLIIHRAFGRDRALRSMRERGVPDDLALSAVGALATPDHERDRARALGTRLRRETDTVERLAARLVRRGFGVADALDAARDLVGEDLS